MMRYTGTQLDRQHPTDAGYDLHADYGFELPPGGSTLVGTGVCVEIPAGHVGLIRGRSGLALYSSIFVFEGTIDSGYRGEIKVLLLNMNSRLPAVVQRGSRIAQLVVVPCLTEEAQRVESLSEGDRGDDGFGSTGR